MPTEVLEKRITLADVEPLALFGVNDQYLHLIERRLGGAVIVRGNVVVLRGDAEEIAALEALFAELIYLLRRKCKRERC
jgi:phosphate starvation-inducible PhoH-like protein